MAGLSMPEARFAKKISFAVGGRLWPAGPGAAGVPAARSLPPTAKAAGKKKSPGHSGQGTDNFA